MAATAEGESEGPTKRRLWLGGQVLGDERWARSMAGRGRQREAEREMRGGLAEEIPRLAAKVAKRNGVTVEQMRSRRRTPALSSARRDLVRMAVVANEIRPVDVSRFLRIATASVTAHLRAIAAG